MKTTALLLSALFVPAILPAQDWPAIPQDQLSLDRAPHGLRLNAIVLYHSLGFDDQKRTAEEHLRIKILTEEGREHANIEIPFFKGITEVADIRARTVQPDGRITTVFEGAVYEKTVVRAKRFRYLAKTFTMPDVQAGSILEYRYTIKRKEIGDASWPLQFELYTLHARFSIKPAMFPGVYLAPILRWTPINVTEGLKPNQNTDGSVTLEIDDLPALETEPYALPERELKPRFQFYYMNLLTTVEKFWAETFKAWWEETEKFLGKPKDLADAVASTVSASDSAEQKLRKIYARVQRLRNFSHEGGLTSQELRREEIKENKSAQDVWKRGYGTGRDIDLLFVALARAAGFDSGLVMYVGRNQGLFHRNLPAASQFNGYLAVVTLKKPDGKDENVFLDPAVPTLHYGMLDWDSTGVTAVRPHSMGGNFIGIPNQREWGGTILRKATFDLDNSGRLSGTVMVSFTGQDALWRRKQAKEGGLDETRKREDLEDTMKAWVTDGARVKLLKMRGWEDSEESLTAEFSLEIPDFAASTARRLLAPATVFRTHHLLQDAVQHAGRVFGFYFNYGWEEDDDIAIRLPAGTDVEELPAPAMKEMPMARYQSSCEKQPGVLRMKRLLAVNAIYYSDTGALREFFSAVRISDENIALLRRQGREGSGR